MTAFVKSVEYLEITLTGAGPTSANLTKGQTIADCVPFFAVNLTDTVNDFPNRRYVDVFFEAGPKVTAQRDNSTGTVIVGVFVVEFDTSGNISVEQGTWDLLTSETGTTEAITSVTTTKAFCVISYRHGSVTDDFNEAQVAVSFNSGIELAFDRVTATGAVTGRYYVVSTSGTDFSVQHVSIALASASSLDTSVISAVTLNRAFVYSTFSVAEEGDDIREGGIIVDISTTTTVRARRAYNSFGSAPATVILAAATIETQVVSAGGTEFLVERNECDWGDALTQTVNITAIDQDEAIIVAGGYMGVMSSGENAGAQVDGNYATLKFNTDSQIIGTRATNTNPDGTTMFEVVAFELAGAHSAAGAQALPNYSQAAVVAMLPSAAGVQALVDAIQAGLVGEIFSAAGVNVLSQYNQAGLVKKIKANESLSTLSGGILGTQNMFGGPFEI